MTDAERLAVLATADPLFDAMDAHMNEVIGHKLFTLMVVDRAAHAAARVYSSAPETYPVKGRKPLGELTEWGEQVLGRGEPFLGSTAEDIRAVFPDHESIARLGCASVLNVPVTLEGAVIGTMNLLHEEGWYRAEHAERAAPFAALLAPAFKDWIAAFETGSH
ncbi:MAG: GAF domain-containing protein [Pseudomonadota bacterium]